MVLALPWGLYFAYGGCVANTVHHDRPEFLKEKGRHPFLRIFPGKDTWFESDHDDDSAHPRDQ